MTDTPRPDPRPQPEPLPVAAVFASALMAANYGGDSGEDVDRLIAEMWKRGLRLTTAHTPAQPVLSGLAEAGHVPFIDRTDPFGVGFLNCRCGDFPATESWVQHVARVSPVPAADEGLREAARNVADMTADGRYASHIGGTALDDAIDDLRAALGADR